MRTKQGLKILEVNRAYTSHEYSTDLSVSRHVTLRYESTRKLVLSRRVVVGSGPAFRERARTRAPPPPISSCSLLAMDRSIVQGCRLPCMHGSRRRQTLNSSLHCMHVFVSTKRDVEQSHGSRTKHGAWIDPSLMHGTGIDGRR